jgi:hypothetical protein
MGSFWLQEESEAYEGFSLRGSWVQWARQMGQVTLPWRTLEEMQAKWKA